MFERILVIESDSQVQKYMGSFLEKHKYQCVLTDKGKVGWSVLRNSSMDLIILDMMLEDYGALEFIRDVRSVSQIPIIATSFMKGEDAIVIEALECGADDYIRKPFGEGEFLARIRARCRRRMLVEDTQEQPIFKMRYLAVDFGKMRVIVHGRSVHLTPTEYRLLSVLINNRGCLMTYEDINDAVWGKSLKVDIRKIRVYIGTVRKKIDDDYQNPRFIQTVEGAGYRLVE